MYIFCSVSSKHFEPKRIKPHYFEPVRKRYFADMEMVLKRDAIRTPQIDLQLITTIVQFIVRSLLVKRNTKSRGVSVTVANVTTE